MKTASIAGHTAAALLGTVLAVNAYAQSAVAYPSKSVRIVVPYPPGGGNDLLGRPIAQKLAEKWGHSVVIDNRGGASGMIGADVVAKSAPDGYTILLCASPEVALNVTLYPKMAYNPARDFTTITQLAVSSLVLTAHPRCRCATRRNSSRWRSSSRVCWPTRRWVRAARITSRANG